MRAISLSTAIRPPVGGTVVRAFLLLLAIIVGGCATPVARDVLVSGDQIDTFNEIGNTAAADPLRKSRSGNSDRFAVAIDSIIQYDRQNTHFFFQDLSAIARDYHEGYIDRPERTERVWKVFSDRGVLLNRYYKNAGGVPLLKLDVAHRLSADVQQALRDVYGAYSFEMPELRTVSSRRDGLGNNYVFFDMAVINPPGIQRVSEIMGLDYDSTVDTVAIHESVHHIHRQLMGRSKFSVYSPRMKSINEAIKPWHMKFGYWTEVEEFLADAVSAQSGGEAIRFIATRVLRSADAADQLNVPRRRRLDPHDASARFVYRLMKRREIALDLSLTGIDALRKRSGEKFEAFRDEWIEYMNLVFDDEFESQVADEFQKASSALLKIVLPDQS